MEAHAYLSEVMKLHQSLDWSAACPYLARRVGGEDDGAARAFVHCENTSWRGALACMRALATRPTPTLRGRRRRRPRPSRVGVPRGQYPLTSASAPGVRASAPLLVKTPSGGPPGRGRCPSDRRPARRLPRPECRTIRLWGRGRAFSGGMSLLSVRAPLRHPTRVRRGRSGRPTGRQ